MEEFNLIEKYGEVYTDKEYITNPAIGRDDELKALLLVMLTPEKSAILVGKPGVGKTAVIEGLAYQIQKGNVPNALKDYKIINVKTASLLGNLPNGESKVHLLIEELKKEEKVILFIDEIHMLVNSTEDSALDFANIFKEGLGRGSIKIVGATTDQEYEIYILRDKAFTRRFQKIDIEEPTRDETVKILMGTLPSIEKKSNIKLKYTNFIKEMIMGFITDITSEYKRVYELGSRYPDCALTLLKGAFSEAIFKNKTEVSILDVEAAIRNTKLIYPDVIKKNLPLFKEQFKDIYKMENALPIKNETKENNLEDEINLILNSDLEENQIPSKIIERNNRKKEPEKVSFPDEFQEYKKKKLKLKEDDLDLDNFFN